MTRGLVIRGSRNVFTVLPEPAAGNAERPPAPPHDPPGGETLECRIKGKVLKGTEGFFNPLAPGDTVHIEKDPLHPGTGLVTAIEPRRNTFTRFTMKGHGKNRDDSSQLLAANIDLIFCVVTPASPPFRPRFLDRALVQAEASEIEAVIVCNKWDLFEGGAAGYGADGYGEGTEERLEDFSRIGYTVLRVSAKTGAGMDALGRIAENRLSVLMGQSGAGKSTIINYFLPGAAQKTGAINEKYDRGNHTTTMSVLFGGLSGTRFIDTPGIRLFLPDGTTAEELIYNMREFAPLAGTCSFGLSCTHTAEPGCKILESLRAGAIHEDRYESYLRIRQELAEAGRA